MREKHIGILCLQESHLTAEYVTQINTLFDKRICVLNSADPTRPSNSIGVAFVINKEIINTDSAECTTLIPGRAIHLSITWHSTQKISIINIYAPNAAVEHPPFWAEVYRAWATKTLPLPDLLLGDFNLTEDPLDRAPAHPDDEAAIDALRDLQHTFDLTDTWQQSSPHDRTFTFSSNANSMSRLDRIYVSTTHSHSLSKWKHEHTTIPTDHKMVLALFAPPQTLHIGKGCWSWPLGLLNDQKLTAKITELGIKLQTEASSLPEDRSTENIQRLWENFKQDIGKEAKATAKIQLTKIKNRITAIKDEISQENNTARCRRTNLTVVGQPGDVWGSEV